MILMFLSMPHWRNWISMREPMPSTTSASPHSSRPSGSVDAQRIAAVEHAAAAPIAEHRRLQHGGQRGDFLGRALRAAAADDHRVFGGAQELRGLADRGLVELRRRVGQRRLRRHRARLAPDVDRALQRRPGPAGPIAIARIASATRRGACSGFRISAE